MTEAKKEKDKLIKFEEEYKKIAGIAAPNSVNSNIMESVVEHPAFYEQLKSVYLNVIRNQQAEVKLIWDGVGVKLSARSPKRADTSWTDDYYFYLHFDENFNEYLCVDRDYVNAGYQESGTFVYDGQYLVAGYQFTDDYAEHNRIKKILTAEQLLNGFDYTFLIEFYTKRDHCFNYFSRIDDYQSLIAVGRCGKMNGKYSNVNVALIEDEMCTIQSDLWFDESFEPIVECDQNYKVFRVDSEFKSAKEALEFYKKKENERIARL